MIWNLLGVFIIGLCSGAFAYLLRRLSKGRLPKWLIPIFAAAGMFIYLAYYDYQWFDFKKSQLPANSFIYAEQRQKDFFKPWSYIAPAVSQFSVFDGQANIQTQDGARIVEYKEYRFFKDPTERMQVYQHVLNCRLQEGVVMGPIQSSGLSNGKVSTQPHTQALAADDPLLAKLCF